MITFGWLVWLTVMFLFLVPSIGYGWGYRKWGPPYPRFIQQRRAQSASSGGTSMFDHYAWGRGGDFIWVVAFIGVFWAIVALTWH